MQRIDMNPAHICEAFLMFSPRPLFNTRHRSIRSYVHASRYIPVMHIHAAPQMRNEQMCILYRYSAGGGGVHCTYE